MFIINHLIGWDLAVILDVFSGEVLIFLTGDWPPKFLSSPYRESIYLSCCAFIYLRRFSYFWLIP